MTPWKRTLALAAEHYRRGATARARSYAEGRGVSVEVFAAAELGEGGDGRSLRSALPDELRACAEDLGLIDQQYGFDRMQGRLVFPIVDEQGAVTAMTGRDLTGTKDLRYLTTRELPDCSSNNVVYGLWGARDAIREKGFALLVEGPLDLLVTWSFGWRHAVAGLGTNVTARQLDLLARATNKVAILFDEPREDQDRDKYDELVGGVATGLQERGLEVVRHRLPRGEDPASYFKKKMEKA